jgi:hypothetical protein
VTQREQPPDPTLVAAVGDIAPYLRVVRVVALLGTPAEIAVPIVRRLGRQTGVSAGPGLTTLVNAIVALALTHFIGRPPQGQQRNDKSVPGWAGVVGRIYLVLSPAAAPLWRGGVIFPRRSPLWAVLISPTTGLLRTLLGLVVIYRVRRAKRVNPDGAEDEGGTQQGAGVP